MNDCKCNSCLNYRKEPIKITYVNIYCVHCKTLYIDNKLKFICKINKMIDNKYCIEKDGKCIQYIDRYIEGFINKIKRNTKELITKYLKR